MNTESTVQELEPDQIVTRMTGHITPHPTEPDRAEAFLPSPCVQNHAANLAFLPDGSLACVWFGGTMEGMGDISIWMATLPPGSAQWSPARRLTDDATRSEQNPILFTAPDGVVWLFHTSQPGGRQEACEIMARQSPDGGLTFGAPQRVGDFTGVFVRQPLRITASGAWLLPGFRCIAEPGQRWSGGVDTAVALLSHDQGASWQAVDVPGSTGAVHMNPVAAGSGMLAFYRDRFAQAVQRSTSPDGEQWSAPQPTHLPNNNSSVQAIRLADGRLAMVLNPVNAQMSPDRRASLYDEIEASDDAPGTGGAIWGVPRAPMTLVISADDGESVSVRRDLETGSGYCLTNNSAEGRNREYSYPSILQDPSGDLHIAYTYHRRAIKYLRLSLPSGV